MPFLTCTAALIAFYRRIGPVAAARVHRKSLRVLFHVGATAAIWGASSSRASVLILAVTSGRISGGGIEMPWQCPVASVQSCGSSVRPSVGRYQMWL